MSPEKTPPHRLHRSADGSESAPEETVPIDCTNLVYLRDHTNITYRRDSERLNPISPISIEEMERLVSLGASEKKARRKKDLHWSAVCALVKVRPEAEPDLVEEVAFLFYDTAVRMGHADLLADHDRDGLAYRFSNSFEKCLGEGDENSLALAELRVRTCRPPSEVDDPYISKNPRRKLLCQFLFHLSNVVKERTGEDQFFLASYGFLPRLLGFPPADVDRNVPRRCYAILDALQDYGLIELVKPGDRVARVANTYRWLGSEGIAKKRDMKANRREEQRRLGG
jgi:hypothetical protein